ncbi:MAG: LLM class flavin-dependent oxidoreductase [Acidobacteria bacterium]|nr:LLM class flavin-dependent oxidoreductase [Acidobacteriota bacterium]
MVNTNHAKIDIFSTTPQSKDFPREDYVRRVIDVAAWSEDAGCRGILVYTDNSIVDPWSVAHLILQNTKKLIPLIAVQPIYMHPYWVAKLIATFGHLYGRRVFLNMLAGGFKNDLTALNDTTPHDERYARLIEYVTIIRQLLSTRGLVSFEGKYYHVRDLRMAPELPPELLPGILLSGSSEAGIAAARTVGATIVQYPKPAICCAPDPDGLGNKAGIRVGIVARENKELAWRDAYERFPEDRKGQLAHQLAMRVSDSVWHIQLSKMIQETGHSQGVYWMKPFENHQTFCPYLVGSYSEVSAELARYMANGFGTFIVDIPHSREELRHIEIVFDQAINLVAGAQVTAAT